MDFWQQKQALSDARLRLALDKPAPQSEDDTSDDFFNPWNDLMDGMVSAYNSEVDRLAIDCLRAVRDRTTFELLRSDRGLAAELFFQALADWLCDYGTSPRGVFPATKEIRAMWGELIAKWEASARATWGDDWDSQEGETI